MIYFARIGEFNPPIIKIGTTIHLPARIKQHESFLGCRVQVIGVHDGGHAEEKALHRRFGKYGMDIQVDGRWCRARELFRECPEIMEYVAGYCRQPDLLDQLREKERNRNDVAVKVDADVVSMARLVAMVRKTTIAQYLSDTLAPIVEADYQAAADEIARAAKPRRTK